MLDGEVISRSYLGWQPITPVFPAKMPSDRAF
jgi:hypothetical protein